MTKEKKYSKRKQQVKRQLFLIAVVTVLVAGSLGIYILSPSSESREAAGAVAVSYTHLDVYKRQEGICAKKRTGT